MDMPITIHGRIKKLPHPYPGDRFKHPREPVLFGHGPGHDDFVERLAGYAQDGGYDAAKLILTGVFDRFPKLRIYWGENQIGWIPHFLEQMDIQYRVHRYWGESVFGVKIARPPSEYVREHCYWGFLYNPVGVELRHKIGVDKLLWGTDFPHVRTNWPDSRGIIDEMFATVPEEERYQMVCGNVINFFHLENSVEIRGQ
jgi:predicted TIM-barrel fold metal-dependent hydrolase